MNRSIVLSVVVAAALIATGCAKSPIGPGSQVPQLPSTLSMSIPSMGDQGLGKQSAAASTIAHGLAAYAVSYWSLTVQLALLEPVTLFAITHSVDPTPLDDNGGYVWEIGDANFSAQLTGRVENDSVRWSMAVSGGALNDFVWFEGVSTVTGKHGTWTFYDTAMTGGQYPAFVQFAYDVRNQADAEVKVSIIKQDDQYFGNYLQWAVDGDACTFEAYDAQTPETILISWNKVTESGSVENVTTGAKACWDTKVNGYQDISCN